ncbi:hypothetical protein TNCV_1587721 [Trichonephila clavipes]|uniref:Uncharacterized protein n=1 Tax=Trichonephila clavipes TaxID=2585209 RepID=A0A8X6RGB3_TRICX|nr:hypothetical protein TNCV_1587721 [Trichonephila clavipes]
MSTKLAWELNTGGFRVRLTGTSADAPQGPKVAYTELERVVPAMHNGAPARFAIVVRSHLCAIYPGRWIGRCGPIVGPPRFLDLNLLNFFLWATLNHLYARRRWL